MHSSLGTCKARRAALCSVSLAIRSLVCKVALRLLGNLSLFTKSLLNGVLDVGLLQARCQYAARVQAALHTNPATSRRDAGELCREWVVTRCAGATDISPLRLQCGTSHICCSCDQYLLPLVCRLRDGHIQGAIQDGLRPTAPPCGQRPRVGLLEH